MNEPTKPVCPDHHVEMVRSYQLDLEEAIRACPNLDCKQRYRDGSGYVTTDDFPSSLN
jgi:hypothetical protein